MNEVENVTQTAKPISTAKEADQEMIAKALQRRQRRHPAGSNPTRRNP
jgi:hypothetical protein